MTTYATAIQVASTLVVAIWLCRRAILHLQRRKVKQASGCLPIPKVPDWDPFLGLGFTYEFVVNDLRRRQLIANVVQRFDQYGRTCSATMMGYNLIFTCEPENTKAILVTQFDQFSNRVRGEGAHKFMGQGIFLSDGEQWQRSRALVRPNFARDQIADLRSLEHHFQELLSLLPRDESVVDLMPLFFAFTMDTATDFLFGDSVKALKTYARSGLAPGDERQSHHWGQSGMEEFTSAWEYAQNDMLARFVLGPAIYLWQDREAERSIKMVHAHVDRYVDEAVGYYDQLRTNGSSEKEPEGRYIFLYALARNTRNRRALRDELMNILMAGRDTTASLLSNIFDTLARRPDIWAKLKGEVSFLNGKPPTYEDLRSMKYLRWCINECK